MQTEAKATTTKKIYLAVSHIFLHLLTLANESFGDEQADAFFSVV